MNYKKGISVIIPVYNAEKYIRTCITSIVLQTFKDLEVIFVIDKKSSDNSEKIIKENVYQLNDYKIIKPTESSGAGYNRNIAIEQAKREYIGFVDADDFISKDFYEKLYSFAQNNNADVAIGGMIMLDENKKIIEAKNQNNVIASNISEMYSMMEYSTVWDKIYRTDIIKQNNVIFSTGVMHEDNTFMLKALLNTKKMVSVPNVFYYWNRNSNSITMIEDNQQQCIDDAFIVFNQVLDILSNANIPTDYKDKIVCHNMINYAGDALKIKKYYIVILNKLKLLLGKDRAYEICYKLEHNQKI